MARRFAPPGRMAHIRSPSCIQKSCRSADGQSSVLQQPYLHLRIRLLIFALILYWLFAAVFSAGDGLCRQSLSLVSVIGYCGRFLCRRWSLYAYAALSLFFLFFRSTAPVAPDAAVIIQSRSRLASPVFSGEDELPVFPSSCVAVFGELFPPPPDSSPPD